MVKDLQFRAEFSPNALLVATDLEARIGLGVVRYGHRLETFNGRDALKDLYEEVLDAVHYSKQVCLEQLALEPHSQLTGKLRLMYASLIGVALDIQELLPKS